MYLIRRGPAWLQHLAEQTADFFFPWGTYCVVCGNYIDRSRSYCLCDHCIRHITCGHAELLQEEGGIRLDSIRACMKYGLYERRLIFDLKYNGHTYMARILAQILADRIRSDAEAAGLLEADFIVPVPMHRKKEKKRGFNQAAMVAA